MSSEVDSRAVAVLLDKLRRIPDHERQYTVTAPQALVDYQVPAGLLDVLRGEGLPAEQAPDGWRYDLADLLNVALHLDIGSRHRRAFLWWIRELGRPYGDTVRYRLDYLPGCPDPEHPGPCRYSLLGYGGERVEVTGVPGSAAPLYSLQFRLDRRPSTLPARLRRLVDEVAGIQFVRLHDPLRWDTDFIRATGMGDCCGVAVLMVDEANRRGIPARMSAGRSLTPPFSTGHFWAEFQVGQRWVALDPVLITALREWGIADPATWTRYDSFGGIMGRLGDRRTPLALHDGTEIEPKLATARIPEESPRTREQEGA